MRVSTIEPIFVCVRACACACGGVAARSCQTAHDEVRLRVYREAVCVCVCVVCVACVRVYMYSARMCVRAFVRACACARVCLCARVWLEIDPEQRASEHTFGHPVCFADFPYYLCGFGQFERGGGSLRALGRALGAVRPESSPVLAVFASRSALVWSWWLALLARPCMSARQGFTYIEASAAKSNTGRGMRAGRTARIREVAEVETMVQEGAIRSGWGLDQYSYGMWFVPSAGAVLLPCHTHNKRRGRFFTDGFQIIFEITFFPFTFSRFLQPVDSCDEDEGFHIDVYHFVQSITILVPYIGSWTKPNPTLGAPFFV